MTLLIAYELHTMNKDYTSFFNVIKSYSENHHPMNGLWFINPGTDTIQNVYDKLRPHMDNADNILIINIKNGAHQGWLPKGFWDWLNKQLAQ